VSGDSRALVQPGDIFVCSGHDPPAGNAALSSVALTSPAERAIAAFHATEPVAVRACLNCDAPVTGHFCAECGQSREDHSRSLLTFFHEFVEHHLLLDSKMLRTAYALVLRPGRLTRGYVEGRRVHYVSPFRLYLFMSFVFFLALYSSGLAVFQISGRIDLPSIQFDRSSVRGDDGSSAFDMGKIEFFRPVHDGALEISPATLAGMAREGANESDRSRRAGKGLMMALEHPRLLNGVLDDWLPRLLVLLLPFVALFLALFGRKRGLFYVDHLAFALHGQAFAFLLGTIAIGARRWLPELPELSLGGFLGGATLVWTVLAYRHVYRSGWFGTLFKIGFIGSIYAVTLLVDLLIALIYGLSEIPT